ncbi:MAG: ferrous iron transport protein B, partial [Bacteroidota bacterium]
MEAIPVEKKIATIALVGNPNCGKSTLFNQLTGLRQKVGNFPGVTVDKKEGTVQLPNSEQFRLLDLPGLYSLYPNASDERVVLNILSNPSAADFPDAIIYLVDVTHLEKHLLLFTQLYDLGFPMILGLNMVDLAEAEGMQINTQALSDRFKVPVVLMSARTGQNLSFLQEAIANLPPAESQQKVQDPLYRLQAIESTISTQVAAIHSIRTPYHGLLLAHHATDLPFLTDKDKRAIEEIRQQAGFESLRHQIDETMDRFNRFLPLIEKTITRNEAYQNKVTERIDQIITHRVFGPLIFLSMMVLLFQAIFAWSAVPMDLIDAGFAASADWARNTLPAGWGTDLLVDGIIAGLGGILIFIPQIAILFFLIAMLEEIGYMARAVFMFDRLMQRFGLNGRSMVALISGAACAIPAVMSTRTISNWKERLITILVTPFISCSARIPVYAILIGFVVPADTVGGFFNQQGLVFMGLYLLGVVAALVSAWIFKKILKSKDHSFLMLELPTYKKPQIRNVLLTVFEKVKTFTLEAGKVILVISIILWFLASYGPKQPMAQAEQQAIELAADNGLDEAATADLIAAKRIEYSYAGYMGKAIEPLIEPLGFDWKIGIALITSFAAREVFVGTIATIYSVGSSEDERTIREKMTLETRADGRPRYDFPTALSLLLFYVFAMQCMSTLAVVRRETNSWKWPIVQLVFMTGLAYFS